MKIRIKSGECPDFLTVGKNYSVIEGDFEDGLFSIKDDYNEVLVTFIHRCPHLNGGKWELVDEDE